MTSEASKSLEDSVDTVLSRILARPEGDVVLAKCLEKLGIATRKIARFDDFPTVTDPERVMRARYGIIIDVETTGVDAEKDEVIELAMLKIAFDDEGIIELIDIYDEFHQPTNPIPEEVTQITGITNEMVAGHVIHDDDIASFMEGCEIVLAHNASFDRKFVERCFPKSGFEAKSWFCTLQDIDWPARGKNGRSLEQLALSEGYVYGSHRANADVIATAFTINSVDAQGRSAFAEMLEAGSQNTLFIIAENSRFEAKDLLKERGYRWAADGSEAFGYKAWYTQIADTPEAVMQEAEFLRAEIYATRSRGVVTPKDVALPMYRIDATTRYSARRPGAKEFFRTAEIQTIEEAAQQRDLTGQLGLGF